MNEIIGRVTTVAGSQMSVHPETDRGNEGSFRIGVMVKTRCADRDVIATIGAIRCEGNDPSKRLLIADSWEKSFPRTAVNRTSGGV